MHSFAPATDSGYCPVKLGMMSNRLQQGVNTLQGFREDKRNRVSLGRVPPSVGPAHVGVRPRVDPRVSAHSLLHQLRALHLLRPRLRLHLRQHRQRRLGPHPGVVRRGVQPAGGRQVRADVTAAPQTSQRLQEAWGGIPDCWPDV